MDTQQQKQPVRAELARSNGTEPKADPRGTMIEDAMQHVTDPILRGEWEFVLKLFEDLKKHGEAELRISTTPTGPARQAEIIYAGIHQKRSLSPLRRLYKSRDRVIRG